MSQVWFLFKYEITHNFIAADIPLTEITHNITIADTLVTFVTWAPFTKMD